MINGYKKRRPKNNWRRALWNRIAARVSDRRAAVVLYLPGMEDLDRDVAISKGFRSENLIAVDSDASVIASLRVEKKAAIASDLASVLAYWPPDRPVDVVIADFCCGFEPYVLTEFGETLRCAPIKEGGVVAINIQRGRGREREVIQRLGMRKGMHRGLAFAGVMAQRWASVGALQLGLNPDDPESDMAVSQIASMIGRYMDTKITSYRSAQKSPLFDTCIFNFPAKPAKKRAIERVSDVERHRFDAEAKLQVSAILAVRTRRMSV